jgi:hypothetical protein
MAAAIMFDVYTLKSTVREIDKVQNFQIRIPPCGIRAVIVSFRSIPSSIHQFFFFAASGVKRHSLASIFEINIDWERVCRLTRRP